MKPLRQTRKLIHAGTHRAASLESTIEKVLRFAPVMGITRVANVTGLDSVGIPVVMVCRPNSRSVTVSQGKGIDVASARASGLMECAELYHAETITLPLRLNTYEELRYQWNVADISALALVAGSQFRPNRRLLWCEGWDLMKREKVLVPYELVHTNYTVPLPDGHGCFVASSNGLASGNVFAEAISHGICEVIERDAMTLWKLHPGEPFDYNRLNLTSVDAPICRQLIEQLGRAGLIVGVWDNTSDIGIAAFSCIIIPRDDDAMWYSAAAEGQGCHPSREVALVRALTEAAQTRLTFISGMRDDFGRDSYTEALDRESVTSTRDRILASKPSRSFQDIPHRELPTLEDDVEWELECLRKVGVKSVITFDLTKPEFGLPVVRVIIPGLESALEAGFLPRTRARKVLAEES